MVQTGAGLEVRDVVVRYGGGGRTRHADPGTTAVAGVSLDVAPAEVLALLGPSGCGKSSLLRAVAGLEPVAAGSVRFADDDLAGVPVHRRGFGLMFQEGQLFPHRDVAGNVAYGIADLPRAERDDRVRELLDVVGLAGYEKRPVTTLSGGERQRVALARSLAPRPRLLLLDEPLSALDRGLRERLALDLRAALRSTGTTAVFVTHDHDEAFTVADRVAVMDAGRLLQVAPPEDLWRAPASRRVAEFLGYQAFVPLDVAGLARHGLSAPHRSRDRPDADRSGGLLAVGPRGLRVTRRDDDPGRAWRATVVGSTFRRGTTEVTVDVALPGREGTARLVALADDPQAGTPHDLDVGSAVTVVVDPAGCAAVPA
ncbi:ABC transporter ATP-binding protein [Cellulosimicrobium marinum]|uniref:ABC transporter ATP-binding protein n=1 Tax=Cellulosimicrobium marinum TaxID=1638992 RepID=UPI001E3DA9E8|nr:ABC transporter ATP-binding protein [Cellulosimicrobium marinum]MCB7136118.1 ABC transporter ATP-binding protein [Cellulosimicrobium marinum]